VVSSCFMKTPVFTLHTSRFSVRVQVRFEVRSSKFEVRSSKFEGSVFMFDSKSERSAFRFGSKSGRSAFSVRGSVFDVQGSGFEISRAGRSATGCHDLNLDLNLNLNTNCEPGSEKCERYAAA